MKITELLCSSPESQEEAPTASSAPSDTAAAQLEAPSFPQASSGREFVLVPDNQRKRTHRLSLAQRQQRRQNEAYESRVYNLMLDANELRQQIHQLMERRDLHITRLLLSGQHFQADVLKLSWTLLDGLRDGKFGLSPSAGGVFLRDRQENPEASGGVRQFVMHQGRPTFGQRTFVVNLIRVLALVDGESTGNSACEIRRVCGNAGGCVVEVVAGVTGQVTRDTLAALFPHVLNDEVLESRVLGQSISFSSRLLLYFNAQRRLVQPIAEADVVGAFNALHLDGDDTG
ncbi:hypothetical protein PRIC1_004472 [Phytophthora ramorum]